ncbi:hypothetical protein PPL_06703 [Heterostelium album PN500]|uniref:B box-type domain-containing protein n=1 Tax=Heterostelium pallidum (strain ATCC 26659 / Pp 5 / PN500) TaxID=670386 RepID=D3BFG9_HETP5|nr:hypothetical protein PPL_06703 [Heterostelium album PN500]EFA79883.1 hypothetical protein PPL_06703 [Heterostelium album PN500]|eukprot:XP_020432004.1 hypothetical protein PPL_06703 [Heterostelium album PN500]
MNNKDISNGFECSAHKRILDAVCYECNKLLCSRCSTNHNKEREHSNFIDHIDDIRIELTQILNNINNVNNNKDTATTTSDSSHISKRLDDIWNMMKCKTENYNSLSSDEKQISKHFEELHKYLMIEEQKLKKPIIDHKDNNNDSTTSTTSSSSFHDDTTESYSIPFIMKSINSSESLSTFIKSNNETLFHTTSSKNSYLQDTLLNYNNNSDSMILDLIYKYNNQFKSSSFKNNNNNNDNDNKTNNRKLELKQFDFTKLDHLLKQSIKLSSNSTSLNNNHNKHTYILSTHDDGASLIDLSNYKITDLGEIKYYDLYGTQLILAGDNDDRFIRFNIQTKEIKYLNNNKNTITIICKLPMIYHKISEVESYIYMIGGIWGGARYSIEKDQWKSFLSDDKLIRYSATIFEINK